MTDRLALLFACWRSEQIAPSRWLELLAEEPGLAEYVEHRMRQERN